MLRSVATALLLFAFAPAASADVIYQYTGVPFDNIFGNWAQVFGTDPTNITATVDVADPFPMDPFFIGGSVGSFTAGNLPGVLSASISDGVRTIIPDTVFLAGYGTGITEWLIGGNRYPFQGSSDSRAITTSNIGNGGGIGTGDHSILVTFDASLNPVFSVADTNATGQWVAVVTPETNTGALALVSVSLLLVGVWRKRRQQ